MKLPIGLENKLALGRDWVGKLLRGNKIIGQGLSLSPKKIQLALTDLAGDRIRILGFKTRELFTEEEEEIKTALAELKLPKNKKIAMNLWDKSLQVKKVSLPMIPAREIPEALRWKMVEDVENVEDVETEMVIRYSLLEPEISHPNRQELMLYGISRKAVEKTRARMTEMDLNVAVAEPVGVSLASLLEVLDPSSKKVRGIFYQKEGQGEFAGLIGRQIYYGQHLTFEDVDRPLKEDSVSAITGDFVVGFQHCVDAFLLENELSRMDEILLAGDWEEGSCEMIHQSLGISCSFLGAKGSDIFLWEDSEQKSLLPRYAAELALSIYPNRAI